MPKKISPIDAAINEMLDDQEADLAELRAVSDEQQAWDEWHAEWQAARLAEEYDRDDFEEYAYMQSEHYRDRHLYYGE